MTDQEFSHIISETKRVVLSAIEKHLEPEYYHVIDDVVQETYLRAYRSLVKNKFQGKSKLSTWLYTIARNETLRMNGKLNREREKFEKSIEKYKQKQIDLRERADNIELLRDMITGLPDKYRDVVELLSLGFTEKQIATKLDLKRGTVKSRLSRGREMLFKLYEGGLQ